MITFTLFAHQPAEQGRAVHIAPWAVVNVTEAEYKRRTALLGWVWVPVAVLTMCHGGVFVVEDYDRSARIRVEAGKREAKMQDDVSWNS